MVNISISIEEENLNFLNLEISNRSKYINELIQRDRALKFAEKMKQGYLAQKNDSTITEEDRLWEATIGDGIDEED